MATVQSEVPMVGSVAQLVKRMSKVEDPIVKMAESKKQLHIVVYEYKAQQCDEIDMDVNDIIEIMKTVEDGWNRGRNERTGKSGMYPTNYCEVYRSKGALSASAMNKQYVPLKKTEGSSLPHGEVPAAFKRMSGMEVLARGREENAQSSVTSLTSLPSISSSPPSLHKEEPEKEYARVTFEYEAQHEDELSLKVGQTVWVVNKRTTDSGWYEGEVDGRRGLFPDNFVTLIKPSNGTVSFSSGSAGSGQPVIPPPSLSSLSSSTSSLTNTVSGRVTDKPPASLPGAVPVMPLPPQVPAKPPKSVGVGNGVSVSHGTATSVWKNSTSMTAPTSSLASTPSNTLPVTVPSTPQSVVKEEERERETNKPLISSFKDKQANLLASLNISSLNPSLPRPNTGISKSTTKIDQEGVSTENGEFSAKETPLLSHPTKNRPKVPSGVKRPVSMFPPPTSDFSGSSSVEVMTRSEVVVIDHPAPIGTSTSLSPSALSVSPSLLHKEKETPPSLVSSSRSSAATPTPTPILPTNHNSIGSASLDISSSQWVSRSEYNILLAKVAHLEERLALLESR